MKTARNFSYLYLHGFASAPQSTKANYLSDRFGDFHIPLLIPDLNQGNFSQLTLTRQLQQVAAEISQLETPVTLIGSSFGGLTAAWLGQLYCQVQQLILLAPAFNFLTHWLPTFGCEKLQQWEREGFFPVYHYGEQRSLPLHYQFIQDLAQYPEAKLQRLVPTLILHGQHDETIPIQASRNFADPRPWVQLIELDSDHSLMNNLPKIWQEISNFCQLS